MSTSRRAGRSGGLTKKKSIRDINAGRFSEDTNLILITHGLTLRIFLMVSPAPARPPGPPRPQARALGWT